MTPTAKIKIKREQLFKSLEKELSDCYAIECFPDEITLELPADQVEIPLMVRDEVFDLDRCTKKLANRFTKYVWPLHSPKVEEGEIMINKHLGLRLAIEGDTLRLRTAKLIDPYNQCITPLKIEIVEVEEVKNGSN